MSTVSLAVPDPSWDTATLGVLSGRSRNVTYQDAMGLPAPPVRRCGRPFCADRHQRVPAYDDNAGRLVT
jgi:hypothetical protein